MKKEQTIQAEKSYARLYGSDGIHDGIESLRRTLEEEQNMAQASSKTTYTECFKGSNWRRTRIVMWANLIQQFLGVTLLANTSYFLQLGGMSPSNSVMIIQISASLILPGNILSWFLMTMFGRRSALLASTGVVGAMWGAIGIAGCFPSSSAALWLVKYPHS